VTTWSNPGDERPPQGGASPPSGSGQQGGYPPDAGQDGGYPPPNYGQDGGYPPPGNGPQPYEPMPQWAPGGGPYGPPQRSGPNGMAIAALAVGVVGIFVFNIVLGPLAVIFGVIGRNRAKRGASGRGMAIAGIALGIFDVVIWVIVLVAATRTLGYTL
jgi:hypothetical protein